MSLPIFYLVEQRDEDVKRLNDEAAGLRREVSIANAELEARGEALRQVSGLTLTCKYIDMLPLYLVYSRRASLDFHKIKRGIKESSLLEMRLVYSVRYCCPHAICA